MSFLKIKDPIKRVLIVEEFLKTMKNIVRFRLTSWRDFGDLRYSLPTSLGQCIYM